MRKKVLVLASLLILFGVFLVPTVVADDFDPGQVSIEKNKKTPIPQPPRPGPTENQPPIASFAFSPTNPQVGQSVNFDASDSSDPDGTITKYEWDFGDGSTDIGVTVTHSYSNEGSYAVKLKVTDNEGATGETQKSINVGKGPKNPNIQVSPASLDFATVQLDFGKELQLTISNTGQDVLNVTNISSDNPAFTVKGSTFFSVNASSSQNVTITFTPQAEGLQSGKLTISSNDPDQLTVTIQISGTGIKKPIGKPMASFTFSPANPNVGETVAFDASGSTSGTPGGSITNYSWNFGDGTTETGVTTTHNYSQKGSFTVTLTVTDDQGKTDTHKETINVGKIPPKKSLKEIIASLIEGKPAGVSNPDRFIDDSEILEVVDSWNSNTILPEIGYQVTKGMIISILPYWIFEAPVDQPNPAGAQALSTLIAAGAEHQGEQPLVVLRRISATQVKPGDSFLVTLTLQAKDDATFIGVADILPEGWQVEGSNADFFLGVSAGDVKTISYQVTVPRDADFGSYNITGAVKILFGSDESIGGDSQVEVLGEGILSIAKAIAGSDNIIDDTEILNAIQLWVNDEPVPGTGGRRISDEEILELIQYWLTGTPVGQTLPGMDEQELIAQQKALIEAAQNSGKINIENVFFATNSDTNVNNVRFMVKGTGIKSIKVSVFDLSGRRVFDSGLVFGNTCEWDLQSNLSGEVVANGLYLYSVTVRGFSGEVARSGVKKLVVLR